MNTPQRVILACGALIMTIMLLFPPYAATRNGILLKQGFAFIGELPPYEYDKYPGSGFKAKLYLPSQVKTTQLMIQLTGTLFITIALFFSVSPRTKKEAEQGAAANP